MKWLVRGVVVIGIVVVFGFWVYVHDEQMAAECDAGGIAFKEKIFKEWLVTHWTVGSGIRDDGTLLPEGTKASDIETVGFVTDDGGEIAFYSPAGRGAAFDVYFNRYCDSRILKREACPNRACSLPSTASR
jgi:hypothetical protein